MKNCISTLFALLATLASYSQFNTRLLSPIPEPVSNNAVCGVTMGGQPFVYSFGGMDTTKSYLGIHNRSYKLNVNTNTWTTLPDLPSPATKIAAGASCINNIIYIIGGYQVLANGNEISHPSVHRFDVAGDTFLIDGAPLPKATDDHVQTIYKDSLIYIITGWSQNTNIPNVQIYSPQLDTWLIGTPVPNNNLYKSFGASGSILEDTLYYFGGARYASNFPIQRELRKGFINPNNPTDITWTIDTIHRDIVGYRMASTTFNSELLWIGGSNHTYNYDGIGYQGSIPVEPNHRILSYSPLMDKWDTTHHLEINMDYRGIANSGSQLILVGGMDEGQRVSPKTLEISSTTQSIINTTISPISIYPNPTNDHITVYGPHKVFHLQIINLQGQMVMDSTIPPKTTISLRHLPSGMYVTRVYFENKTYYTRLLITP